MFTTETTRELHLLPPLDPVSLPDKGSRVAALTDHLRALALKHQTEYPRKFHSYRSIEEAFGVSIYTVHKACDQLRKEGLLRLRRGSGTELVPAGKGGRKILGLVLLPVYLPQFLAFQEFRYFLIQLEEKLRAANYQADFLFLKQSDVASGVYERIVKHDPDSVFWPFPYASQRNELIRLRDRGVPTLTLQHHPAPCPAFPGPRIQLQSGLSPAFTDWKNAGLSRVLLPERDAVGVVPVPDWLNHSISEHRLEPVLSPWTGPDANSTLHRLQEEPDAGIFFYDDIYWERLCLEQAQGMADLMQHRRVLVHHAVPVHPRLLQGVQIDVLQTDWEQIHREILEWLAHGAHPPESSTIDCAYRPRYPAAELAEHYRLG